MNLGQRVRLFLFERGLQVFFLSVLSSNIMPDGKSQKFPGRPRGWEELHELYARRGKRRSSRESSCVEIIPQWTVIPFISTLDTGIFLSAPSSTKKKKLKNNWKDYGSLNKLAWGPAVINFRPTSSSIVSRLFSYCHSWWERSLIRFPWSWNCFYLHPRVARVVLPHKVLESWGMSRNHVTNFGN